MAPVQTDERIPGMRLATDKAGNLDSLERLDRCEDTRACTEADYDFLSLKSAAARHIDVRLYSPEHPGGTIESKI